MSRAKTIDVSTITELVARKKAIESAVSECHTLEAEIKRLTVKLADTRSQVEQQTKQHNKNLEGQPESLREVCQVDLNGKSKTIVPRRVKVEWSLEYLRENGPEISLTAFNKAFEERFRLDPVNFRKQLGEIEGVTVKGKGRGQTIHYTNT